MRYASLAVGLVVATLASTSARADFISPDEEPCVGLAAGAACAPAANTTVPAGGVACAAGDACVCVTTTCSRVVYACDAGPDGDASALDASSATACNPVTVMVPCLKCYPSPANAGDASADATVPPPEDAGEGDATVGPPADAASSQDAGEGSHAGATTASGCSCSTVSASALRHASPWLLAALVPTALRRRRRRP